VRAKNLLSKCIPGKNETQGEAGSHWAFIVCSWSSNVRKARKSPPPPPPAFTCNFGAFLDLVLAEQGGKPSFSRMSEPTSCKYKAGGSLSDQREKPG